MRREFKDFLLEEMDKNDKIIVLSGDLGYGMFDKIRDKYEQNKRFINVGASEQLLLGIGCGIALEDKIPVIYSITPFLLYRGFEILRTYINHENIPIKLIGGGRNQDYSHDGFSHDASDDKIFLQHLNNLQCFWPDNIGEMKLNFQEILNNNKPSYLNLRR